MNNNDLFCHDLPTKPVPEIGTVLVTGATGYVGGRLVPELIERGYRVRVMARGMSPTYKERWPEAEIVTADALKEDTLKDALKGVHTAYYLIHSMLLGPKKFESIDRLAARNFTRIAAEKKVKRIIYLGGLGDKRSGLSPHLGSRMEVAEELKKGYSATTILRAAIIIGSGSASYEMIKHLVKNMPVLFIPHWAKNRCQPIAIRDVIKYLVGVLEKPETANQSYDIGGLDILTYEMILKIQAELFGVRRFLVPSPTSGIGFHSYFGSLLTPVPAPIIRCLMEGLKNEVVCENETIKYVLPFKPLSYKEAILRAMSREEQDNIHTRWSDAYPPAHVLALKLNELERPPQYRSSYSIISRKSTSRLFQSICQVGGKEGWFHSNWMWRLRGSIDKILLGVGTSRGRRSASSIKINDVIDFWRVEDLKPDESLLLRAEMKLPGRAWMGFRIEEETLGNRLYVNAYFQPQGLFGNAYWYLFLPFHNFIFYNLIRQIEKRS